MIIRLCLAVALLAPATAFAQGNPGPFGKLFGREPARESKNETTVDVNGSVGGQFGDALPGSVTDDAMPEGIGSGATAGVRIAHISPRVEANFLGGVIREYYFTDPAPPALTEYHANANVRGKVGSRFEPSAAASYRHSPYYQLFPVFGQADIAVDNSMLPFSPYAVQIQDTESVDASASLVTHVTSKSTIEFSAFRRQTRFVDQPASDFVSNGYGVIWALRIGRGLGVHAGYQDYHGEYPGIGTAGVENKVIDAGLDFNRAFSLSRRTTFAIATSTSLTKDSNSNESRFRLNGEVNLAKYFRRTWNATLSARRSTEFVPGFIEPLFSDTVGVSISGMFTQRLDFLAYASGGQGEYAFSRSSGFNSLTASSRLRVALAKHLSAYGQYLVYRYETPRGVTTLDLPSRMARQSVAVGLSIYVPIYDHVRKVQ